jgi:hypothetical protein
MYKTEGIEIDGLLPEIRQALPLVDQLFKVYDQEATLVQTIDTEPCAQTGHTLGLAFDIKNPLKNTEHIYNDLKLQLGPTFTVIRCLGFIHIAFIGNVVNGSKTWSK